jgi:hypothetical protein
MVSVSGVSINLLHFETESSNYQIAEAAPEPLQDLAKSRAVQDSNPDGIFTNRLF